VSAARWRLVTPFFAADVSVGEFPQRPERKADVVRMRRRGELEEGKRARPGAAADKLLFARAMRGAPTRGEAVLWAELRGRGLSGWRFRRQHVIAGYIVDFYCPRLWLAIEVDGSVHDAQRDDDEERDVHMADLGVDVLRVRDEDVLARLDDVLRAISARCEQRAEVAGVHAYQGRTPKR